jgi:hypothetical protein
MLSDHRTEQERRGRFIEMRRTLPREYGDFIASLAPWDWFINPITFRENWSPSQANNGKSTPGSAARRPCELLRRDNIVTFEPDPRLATWRPQSRYANSSRPPSPDSALRAIQEYFADLQKAAGHPIGWVIGEEFGRAGGRYHCHVLVTGVRDLHRQFWWQEAFRRFGRTRIEPFDAARAAAHYTAKYAAKQLGGLIFGGTLAGVNLAKTEESAAPFRRGIVIAHSAPLPRAFFHMTLPRRHR